MRGSRAANAMRGLNGQGWSNEFRSMPNWVPKKLIWTLERWRSELELLGRSTVQHLSAASRCLPE